MRHRYLKDVRDFFVAYFFGGMAAAAGAAGVAVSFSLVAAWITHVIVCIKASAWILLLFGCIVAPVGVIHGFGVWFGVF